MVAIYFVAAAVPCTCSTIHYDGALELIDYICGWSVFGHHTVTAVILCCRNHNVIDYIHKLYVASLSLSLSVDLSTSASARSYFHCLLNCLVSNSESESVSVSESFQIVSTSFLVHDRFLLALIDYDARQQTIY